MKKKIKYVYVIIRIIFLITQYFNFPQQKLGKDEKKENNTTQAKETNLGGMSVRYCSGTLVKSSGWQYNDTALAGRSLNSGSTSTKGTYYAQSQVSFYNGNGYNTYTSNASPRIQRSSVPMITEKPYEVNEYGLTYGSGFYAESLEDYPDLIQVIGKNGVEGYVYSKDINLELNTLDEVLDYINSGQSDYTVPVYTEDGITIVDTFEIVTED